MKKIAIDCGHTLNGSDYGAVGVKHESDLTREVGRRVIKLLSANGYTVIDCTCDNSGSLSQSLRYRVDKCNSAKADLFVSIHFNAFNKSAYGTEIWVDRTNGNVRPYADRVLKNIASLGFANRGIKHGADLYVLQNTNVTPAMLVECCFCDNQEDMKKFNAETMAKAIAEGIIGSKITTPSGGGTTPQKPSEDTSLNGRYGVATDALNVRSGAGTNYGKTGELKKGEKVKIHKKVGNWYSIYYGSNGGYVSADYIKLEDLNTVKDKYATVATDVLNVRYTPNGKVIGQALRGQKLKMWRLEGEWMHIYSPVAGFNQAYVHKDYIKY